MAALPIIEVRDLFFSYGRQRILEAVEFRIEAGEIVAIVGENGAGKTTLLKIIVGLLRPGSGKILIHGRIGYCPQECLLFEDLTVAENIQYFSEAYGVKIAPTANRVLNLLDLRSYNQVLVSRLSAGTRQKLNLSIALLHSPAILVLDEPYSSFDWETYLRFWQLVDSCRDNQVGILIVSHLAHERYRFDRVLELRHGTLR